MYWSGPVLPWLPVCYFRQTINFLSNLVERNFSRFCLWNAAFVTDTLWTCCCTIYVPLHHNSHANYICRFIQFRSSQQPYDVMNSTPDPDYLRYWMFERINMHKEKSVALNPIPSWLFIIQSGICVHAMMFYVQTLQQFLVAFPLSEKGWQHLIACLTTATKREVLILDHFVSQRQCPVYSSCSNKTN